MDEPSLVFATGGDIRGLMDDQLIVLATTAVLVIYFLAQVLTRKFDPSPRSGCSSSATCRSTSSRRSATGNGPWPSAAATW